MRHTADGHLSEVRRPLRFGAPRSISRLVPLLLAVSVLTAGCMPGLASRVAPEDVLVPQSAACDPEVARDRLRAATVRVETWDTRGTAFHVGGGVYLTAAHVVTGYDDVELFRGSEAWPGTVVDRDLRLDVAVLHSDLVLANTLELLDVPPGEGEPAWSYGFSRTWGIDRSLVYLEPTRTWTSLVAMMFEDEVLEQHELAIFRGRLSPGDSGSAVVTACGEVIGLATAYLESVFIRERLAVGVSAEALETLLQDVSLDPVLSGDAPAR